MNRRAFSAYAIIAMVFGLLVPSISQAQSQKMINGSWKITSTGEQFHQGILNLQEQGGTVIGTYKGAMGITQLTGGKMSGNKLSANWRSPKGATGWLTFNFNDAYTSFNGEMGYNGRKATQTIIGRKVASHM
jgi:hypothetical protein